MLSPDDEQNEKPSAHAYANGFFISLPTPYLQIREPPITHN